MDQSPKPEPTEKCLHFGCGFLSGGFVAFFIALQELTAFNVGFWVAVAGTAVAFGVLAMRYGEHFWSSVFDWFRWR